MDVNKSLDRLAILGVITMMGLAGCASQPQGAAPPLATAPTVGQEIGAGALDAHALPSLAAFVPDECRWRRIALELSERAA